MTNMINAINKYKNMQVNTTVNKTKQVIMLYDAIIKNLSNARTAIENNDYQNKFNHTAHAAKIIEGLENCLDYDSGKEISFVLSKFYTNILFKILNLNFNTDKEENITNVNMIIDEISEMKKSWEEVDHQTINLSNQDSSKNQNRSESEVI